MHKSIRLLFITMVLTCICVTTAFASNYDSTAKELQTMGLFNGSNAGFDLDRAPTRSEAAVMLVRLLGKESEAKTQFSSGNISESFTDVADWAAPYVAWLQSKGLANGVSDSLFGANDSCSAQMFCTFVMRSLGYSDSASGDFTYDNALEYAEKLGVFNTSYLKSDTFLRDHAVAVAYQALATELKGTSTTLLSKLVADGAVSEASAKATIDKITAYLAYCKIQSASASIKAMDATVAGTIKLSSVDIANLNMTINMNSAVKVIMKSSDIQMEEIISTATGVTTQNFSMWIKDGYIYIDTGTNKVKQALDSTMLSTILAQQTKNTAAPSVPLYLLNGISSSKTNGGIQYNLDISNIFNAIDFSQLGLDTSVISKMEMKNCSEQMLFKDDGTLSSVKMNCTLDMTMNESGTAAAISCDYDLTTTIKATGDAVTIAFPDFSAYTEQSDT
jgi:hypothetical protein